MRGGLVLLVGFAIWACAGGDPTAPPVLNQVYEAERAGVDGNRLRVTSALYRQEGVPLELVYRLE